jgi:hypothetical protein
MRARLIRGIAVAAAAAIIGVVVAAPARAAPAQAAPPATTAVVPIGQIITVVQQAYSLYRSFTQHSISVQEATSQILAAIDSARTQIMAHVDAIAAAQARACARSTLIDFTDFDAFTPDNQQAFARDATGCLLLADSLLRTVTDKAAINELGLAFDAVGPIALVARARTGLSNGALLPVLVDTNRALTTLLYPRCTPHYEGRLFDEWYCVAFNGDDATNYYRANAADWATRNTSRYLAQAVLPLLGA